MKRKDYSLTKKILASIVNIQMLFAPLAMANETQGTEQISGTESRWSQNTRKANNISNLILQAASAYAGAASGQTQNSQAIAFRNQLAPRLLLTPIDSAQVPATFQGCMVLPARGETLTGDMTCSGAGAGKINAGYGQALQSIAEANVNELRNSITPGHERYTTQGVGCFDKKIQDLNLVLEAREEELRKFEAAIGERVSQFKQNNEELVDQMKENQAILTGQPANSIPENFDFSKEFLNSEDQNVCASFLATQDFTQSSTKGFSSIRDMMQGRLNDTNGGKMRANELLGQAAAMNKDLAKVASGLSNQVKDRDGFALDANAISFSSNITAKLSNAIKRVTDKFKKNNDDILRSFVESNDINQAVSGDPQLSTILNSASTGNTNVVERLRAYEASTKTQCLKDLIKSNFGSIKSFAGKFRDTDVSKTLSKQTDNKLKTDIITALSQTEVDLDTIGAELAKKETGANAKKKFSTGKSFTFGGTSIGASQKLAPSSFIKMFAKNCNEQFDIETNADGITKKAAVSSIKKLNTKVADLKAQAPNDIKKLIRNEIVECVNDTTTGVGAMSCTDALKVNSGNFCIRTAKTCATNMNGCFDKLEGKIEEKTKVRNQAAEVYKNNFQNLLNGNPNAPAGSPARLGLKQELALMAQTMEQNARQIDAANDLGTLFQTPPENQFDLSQDISLQSAGMNDFFKDMNIDDPDKLLRMAQERIADISTSLNKQKTDVIAALEEQKGVYLNNYNSQITQWQNIINECSSVIAEVDRQRAEEEQRIQEAEEEIARGCQALQALGNGTAFVCASEESELLDAVAAAAEAADREARNTINSRQANGLGSRLPASTAGSNGSSVAQLRRQRRMQCPGENQSRRVIGQVNVEYVINYCSQNSDLPNCAELNRRQQRDYNQLCRNGDFQDNLIRGVFRDNASGKDGSSEVCYVVGDNDRVTITPAGEVIPAIPTSPLIPAVLDESGAIVTAEVPAVTESTPAQRANCEENQVKTISEIVANSPPEHMNSIVTEYARCSDAAHMRDDLATAIDNAREDAQTQYVQDQTSPMGQQRGPQITPQMCNAFNAGEYDLNGVSGSILELANAAGAAAASRE